MNMFLYVIFRFRMPLVIRIIYNNINITIILINLRLMTLCDRRAMITQKLKTLIITLTTCDLAVMFNVNIIISKSFRNVKLS